MTRLRLGALVVLGAIGVGPGCSFAPGAGVADDPDPLGPDAGPIAERRCSAISDPALRLCLDFEDPAPFTTALDGSGMPDDAVMTLVSPMARGAEQAAELFDDSALLIAESAELDIPDQITIEMWIHPRSSPAEPALLLDNDRQYLLALGTDKRTRCAILGESATGRIEVDALAWTHVACRYDGDEMRVYVNGAVSACKSFEDAAIATASTAGLAIGADLAPTGTLSGRFPGGIDNVRVYGRALTNAEMCAAAGRTDCRTMCPDSSGPGPGGPGPGADDD